MRLAMKFHLPRLVYAGDIGVRGDWKRWDHTFNSPGSHSIYHLFDSQGELLYIGKAWCPLYRLESHRRKPWWCQVSYLNLYTVSCYEHPLERCRDVGKVTLAWEGKAIADLKPIHNIAGVRSSA